MNQTNNNLMNHQRWNSAANSLWVCALIIGICQIVMTILPSFMPTTPVVSYGYEMEYSNNSNTLTVIIGILSLVTYIATWLQVSNLGTLLNLMNKEQDNTYTHLRRYKIGLQTVIICITIYIALGLFSFVLISSHAYGLAEVIALINFGLLVGILVGGIFQLVGGLGMAFSDNADANMISGMRQIAASWGITLLLVIITLIVMSSNSFSTMNTWLNIVPFVSLLNPILQLSGWRIITKAQYTYNE